jgi:asparagine synthase (glutamine-hydrolysing)
MWLLSRAVSPDAIIAARDTMAHRGPDGASGVLLSSSGDQPVTFREQFTSPPPTGYDIGLGHRRLAIIDLVTGDQPMGSDDGRIWLVFNGEIYNYRELRCALVARGHRFRTQSDTEVLLRAYEEYGVHCTRHLNGIFAFAIWDGARHQMFLARDHFGVKPLYYATTTAGFVFGSEVKALLASGVVSAGIDMDALGAGLTFLHSPAPLTLFRGIRKLPAGSSMIVEDSEATPPRFYTQEQAAVSNNIDDGWPRALAVGIGQAVERQMVSDVPIGLSLSSGVDSSTLLAVMSRLSGDAVRTFTIGFGSAGHNDEVPLAEHVARRFAARGSVRRISDEDYTALMGTYMWHMEEPVGNESALAYYFVADLARASGVKVLLTGQGPDELFAGYDRYVGIAFARWLRLLARPPLRGMAERITEGHGIGEKYRRFVSSAAPSELAQQFLGAYTVFTPEDTRELLRPEVHREIDWDLPRSCVESWLRRAPAGRPLDRMLWIDARTGLSDNLLLAEDKMAMAASVEARVPFLDVEFVRLAEAVPSSMKLRAWQRKHVFRRACAQWIGAGASRRRKIPFANPMGEWFRGNFGQAVLAPLDDPESFLSTYTDPNTVRRWAREHRDRHRDHTRKLYFLASLEAWHSTFIADTVSSR